MINWGKISDGICHATGTQFSIVRTLPVSGGYTNSAWHIEGYFTQQHKNIETHYFVKLNTANKIEMFEAESIGLAALAATNSVRVPHVITLGIADQHAFLILENFDLCRHGQNQLFGAQLAALHRVKSDQFGWSQDNTLSLTLQRNTWDFDWVNFWREQRLGFQLELAASNGYTGRIQKLGQEVMEALPEFFIDYCPDASLLHGDLWAGNYAFLPDGTPVMFDPAPYYGDREADIAMTELFGGFDSEFYMAYDSVYPLAAGYSKRKNLYNLYHILNHCNLVGSSYLTQAEGMMLELIKEVA